MKFLTALIVIMIQCNYYSFLCKPGPNLIAANKFTDHRVAHGRVVALELH